MHQTKKKFKVVDQGDPCEMVGDYMTKPLVGSKFNEFRNLIMNFPSSDNRSVLDSSFESATQSGKHCGRHTDHSYRTRCAVPKTTKTAQRRNPKNGRGGRAGHYEKVTPSHKRKSNRMGYFNNHPSSENVARMYSE